MLADIVSKNGNLLLNVVLHADGSLPPESDRLLNELTPWMEATSEAIHGTRPWKIHGEGPSQTAAGAFAEAANYTARDIRFTTKGDTLYAITLGEPKGQVAITSLARSNPHERRPVRRVRLLGHRGRIAFRQTDQALAIELPAAVPTRHASAFAISFG
jgi:alpha-L-fucosidase